MSMAMPDPPKTPPLPSGTTVLSHQVAGHIYGKSKTKYGLLQYGGNTILKPIQEDERGLRELAFYRTVFDEATLNDSVLTRVRSLLPAFYGTWETSENPRVMYLHMEDVTKRFEKPCILDVKVGPVTYDPYANAEKIARETSKYPPLKTVGFQLIGLRVYSPATRKYLYLDRYYLRKLDERELLTEGLAVFLDMANGCKRQIIASILRRLRIIEKWFESQRCYAFYASSLLLVYEGAISTPTTQIESVNCCFPSRQTDNKIHADDLVDVRMIDFAHVFPTQVADDNYITGLQSLIRYLEDLQT